MKKIYIMMMLVLVGTIAIAQTSVWHGGRQVWTRGAGTESDPFLIESADNLAYLAYVVNKGYETRGLYFRLTTDIDLNGSEDQQWVPIGIGDRWFSEDGCERGIPNHGGFYGIPASSFRGHFDGGEHDISNIYISNDTDDGYNYVGLFGTAEGRQEGQEVYPAVIENVFVISGYLRGRYRCGGVVAFAENATVSRCWNGANIENAPNGAGGIVGEGGKNTLVYNCYNIGDVSGRIAGGVIGRGGRGEIEGCYNGGDITGTYAGGINGYGLRSHLTINNCYNTGNITANEDYGTLGGAPAGPAAGGIAGFLYLGTNSITNCYNVGAVSSTQNAGCILAYGPQVTLENNYYILTCDAGGEGEALSEDYMRSQEFVDFLNSLGTGQTWVLDEDNINNGFPILAEASNLDVAELPEAAFSVYPNPAHGAFTVEGTGEMTVSNVLGQIILTKEIDGQTAVALPQGLYFVKLGGAVRKIVVE